MEVNRPAKEIWVQSRLLKTKITEKLRNSGVSVKESAITAEILVTGSARGYTLHGVERLLHLMDGFAAGTIVPHATAIIKRDAPAIAVIDACHGLGPPCGKMAMDLALKKAADCGVGVVGVINGSHLGALGYYSEIASAQGSIGITMSTSSPAVVVAGGKVKTFGTNPISYSFPHTLFPITADFATSKVSRGKLYNYKQQELPIPSGWAVDSNGDETSDPNEGLAGGLQTIDGDIKGSLISLLVSVLAGTLIGGVINPEVRGTRYMNSSPNKGDIFIVLNINKFTDLPLFLQEIAKLDSFITEQKVKFRLPGSRPRTEGNHQKIKISSELAQTLEIN